MTESMSIVSERRLITSAGVAVFADRRPYRFRAGPTQARFVESVSVRRGL